MLLPVEDLKYCKNYQNVTQKYKVSKYCWKNGPDRLAQYRVATNLQSGSNAVCVKHRKAKCSKTSYACTSSDCLARHISLPGHSCSVVGLLSLILCPSREAQRTLLPAFPSHLPLNSWRRKEQPQDVGPQQTICKRRYCLPVFFPAWPNLQAALPR